MPLPQLVEEALVGRGGVGGGAQREDLPQHHPVRPAVAGAGVDALVQGLRGHPLDGQPALKHSKSHSLIFQNTRDSS